MTNKQKNRIGIGLHGNAFLEIKIKILSRRILYYNSDSFSYTSQMKVYIGVHPNK